MICHGAFWDIKFNGSGLRFQVTCWEAVGTGKPSSQKWLLLRKWSQPGIPREERVGRGRSQEAESLAEFPGLHG